MQILSQRPGNTLFLIRAAWPGRPATFDGHDRALSPVAISLESPEILAATHVLMMPEGKRI